MLWTYQTSPSKFALSPRKSRMWAASRKMTAARYSRRWIVLEIWGLSILAFKPLIYRVWQHKKELIDRAPPEASPPTFIRRWDRSSREIPRWNAKLALKYSSNSPWEAQNVRLYLLNMKLLTLSLSEISATSVIFTTTNIPNKTMIKILSWSYL